MFQPLDSNLGHLLIVSFSCSFGMQLINFCLSKLHILDNFTGLVEFLPAAVYGSMLSNVSMSEDPVPVVLTWCLVLWSLRLGTFLIIRYWHRPLLDTRLTNMTRGRQTGEWRLSIQIVNVFRASY